MNDEVRKVLESTLFEACEGIVSTTAALNRAQLEVKRLEELRLTNAARRDAFLEQLGCTTAEFAVMYTNRLIEEAKKKEREDYSQGRTMVPSHIEIAQAQAKRQLDIIAGAK